MMEKIATGFKDLFLLQTRNFTDHRGSFQKLYNKEFFMDNGLDLDIAEVYFSVSNRGVVRGMHFQLPPDDHEKLVYVSHGAILDVVVDLRTESETYGKHIAFNLDSESGKYLFIPKGFAHGFASLQDGTIVNYAQSSCYAPHNDCGVRFDSCGIEWPFDNPIVSGRDLTFECLSDFKSPFK